MTTFDHKLMIRCLTSICCIIFNLTAFSQEDLLVSHQLSSEKANEFRNFIETSAEPSTVSGTRFFDYHQGIKKAYLFNGEFQLPVTLGGRKYYLGRRKNWIQSLQFTPQVKVRIFQNDPAWKDNSKPVRTPSYIPKISYYVSPLKLWEKMPMQYFGLSVLHHSNGQDGWEFVGDSVNIQNGSFSESLFFQFTTGGMLKQELVHASHFYNRLERKLTKKQASNEAHTGIKMMESAAERRTVFFWRFYYEYHPKYFANQKFYDSGVYGGNRIALSLNAKTMNLFDEYLLIAKKWTPTGVKTLKENFRFSLNLEYITDLSYYSGDLKHLEKISLFAPKKRFNVVLTAYKRCFDSKYPAFFAQIAYYGSDNYNIYFQKSLLALRCGLSFSFFEYQKR